MFWHEHMNTGGWIFMVLGNIVIWGLVVAFIFWLVPVPAPRARTG